MFSTDDPRAQIRAIFTSQTHLDENEQIEFVNRILASIQPELVYIPFNLIEEMVLVAPIRVWLAGINRQKKTTPVQIEPYSSSDSTVFQPFLKQKAYEIVMWTHTHSQKYENNRNFTDYIELLILNMSRTERMMFLCHQQQQEICTSPIRAHLVFQTLAVEDQVIVAGLASHYQYLLWLPPIYRDDCQIKMQIENGDYVRARLGEIFAKINGRTISE